MCVLLRKIIKPLCLETVDLIERKGGELDIHPPQHIVDHRFSPDNRAAIPENHIGLLAVSVDQNALDLGIAGNQSARELISGGNVFFGRHQADHDLPCCRRFPQIEIADQPGVVCFVIGGEMVLVNEVKNHPNERSKCGRLEAAVPAGNHPVAALGVKAGNRLAIPQGDWKLRLISVTLGVRIGENPLYGEVDSPNAAKAGFHLPPFDVKLRLIADVAEGTAPALAVNWTVVVNAVRRGGEDAFHNAKGVLLEHLDNLCLNEVPNRCHRDKDDKSVNFTHPVAVAVEIGDFQTMNLIFLYRHKAPPHKESRLHSRRDHAVLFFAALFRV